MTYQQTRFGYIIRIFQGEEILSTLRSFCQGRSVSGAFFYGLGAVREATIGMYHMDKHAYEFQHVGAHEIANLTGNVSQNNNELVIHAHATLAGTDQTAIGGHLQSAVVEPTCEIMLFTFDPLIRAHDEDMGLPLFDLPHDHFPNA